MRIGLVSNRVANTIIVSHALKKEMELYFNVMYWDNDGIKINQCRVPTFRDQCTV